MLMQETTLNDHHRYCYNAALSEIIHEESQGAQEGICT